MQIDIKIRTMAVAGVTALAGVALIGTSAYAGNEGSSPSKTFASQNPNVVLSASGATGNGTPNITLASLGPTGSSFMTTLTPVTITNNGPATATAVALQLTGHSNNVTFRGETWVCLFSSAGLFVNEPLTVVEGYGQTKISNLTLAPQATATYTVVYYAGSSENTGCGSAFTSYHTLSSDGYSGHYGAGESYPAGTTNLAAASMTNPAEGGTLLATVTVSYLGSNNPKSGDDCEDHQGNQCDLQGDQGEQGDHHKDHPGTQAGTGSGIGPETITGTGSRIGRGGIGEGMKWTELQEQSGKRYSHQ